VRQRGQRFWKTFYKAGPAWPVNVVDPGSAFYFQVCSPNQSFAEQWQQLASASFGLQWLRKDEHSVSDRVKEHVLYFSQNHSFLQAPHLHLQHSSAHSDQRQSPNSRMM
jgi:hypothetical protein